MSTPDVSNVLKTLEAIEEEWLGHAAGDKLAGNIVKEAAARGVAMGIGMAIDLLKTETRPQNRRPHEVRGSDASNACYGA